jgi:hypothetical protein
MNTGATQHAAHGLRLPLAWSEPFVFAVHDQHASAEWPLACKRVDANDPAARVKGRGGSLRRVATGESSDG